jgi:hypothetical protein
VGAERKCPLVRVFGEDPRESERTSHKLKNWGILKYVEVYSLKNMKNR